MEGSPLTPDILFHLGPVPISRAVMTTWAIMAAMAALLVVAFRLRPPGLVAALEIVVMAIVDQLRQIAHQDLWEQCQGPSSQEARRDLVNIYARIVKYVAGRMAIGLPHYVEFNDLISAGLLGLIQAQLCRCKAASH